MNENRDQIYLAALLKDPTIQCPSAAALLNKYGAEELDVSQLQEASELALGCAELPVRKEGVALESLFQQISRNEKFHESEWFLRAVPLSLDKSCFPVRNIKNAKEELKSLWGKFDSELAAVKASATRSAAETALYLLQKFTSNLPSGYATDVSLYDYLKMRAAIAVCLHDLRSFPESEDQGFLLIGGDVSGIQNYINTIVSKYAGKNLKGRSFYLRLLSDTCTRYLLGKLDLYRANIVYNSGGGFYLLAANTHENSVRLEDAKKELADKLFATHGTALNISIDSVPLSRSSLLDDNGGTLGKVWSELFRKRERQKYQRLSFLLESDYDRFFEPSSSGGEVKIDVVSGEEINNDEQAFSERDLSPLKKVNWEQIKLGELLRDFEYLLISEGRINSLNDRLVFEPLELGYCYYLLDNSDIQKVNRTEVESLGCRASLLTMNSDLQCVSDERFSNSILGFDYYGGNEFGTPIRQTFSDMCQQYGEDSLKRLGVLRMDVDNLGHTFQAGIPSSKSSFAKLSALSRFFDYFFSGYLNTIWRNEAPDQSFIIYSGGDDIFMVGNWEAMIRIAKTIREDFRAFTCGNEALSISCGISILPPKFPIMKGAEESAGEEKNAKNHFVRGRSKNSISFLNTPLNWDLEYPAVESLKSHLVSAISRNELPKSFISKVLSLSASAGFRNHSTKYYKLYWMAAYSFGRMLEQKGLAADAQKLVEACLHDICGNRSTLCGEVIQTEYHPLELWALASRWAELEYRTINLS